MALRFIVLVVWALLALWIVFEVLIPLLKGIPIFPTFRKEAEAHKELSEAEEELRTVKVLKSAHEVREHAEQIDARKDPPDECA